MNIVIMPVTDLHPADYNPRKDLKPGDKEYDKLARSIEEFGYVEPIVWNRTTGNIIGGHQRLKVLIEKGYTEVEVVGLELSEQEEKILNVALNKISGRWDNEKLIAVLDELQAQEEMELTGFDDWELEALKVTYDHIENLKQYGADREFEYHDLFHRPGFQYEKSATARWGGISLHPHYEAKTMQWFKSSGLAPESTLFWITGAEPTNPARN